MFPRALTHAFRSAVKMAVMVWCELCDLDRSTCIHGLRDRQTARERQAVVLISPQGMAHFDGCPHKGDDPDFSKWGRLDGNDAWQRIGNGESIDTVDSAGQEFVVTARCSDCVDHGPW